MHLKRVSGNVAVLIVLFCAVLSVSVAQLPRVVFLSADDTAETNQIYSAIQSSISNINRIGTWNSSISAPPELTRIRLQNTSAAALASLASQVRQVPEPSFFIHKISNPSIGIVLSQENVPFVDLSATRALVEPSELHVTLEDDLIFAAATDFLQSLSWNSTILMYSESSLHHLSAFRREASSKNIILEREVEISASITNGIAGALPGLLSTRSNVITVLSGYTEMKRLLESITDVYFFDILWVPVGVSTAEAAVTPADLTNVVNALMSVQVHIAAEKIVSGAPLSSYYAADALAAYAIALNGASNKNNNADIIASLRSLTTISSNTATGALKFSSSSGRRVGDISVVNYKKSGASTVARWSSLDGIVSVVPKSEYIFASGTNRVRPATHDPVFLIGYLWDTVFLESLEWLQAGKMALAQINQQRIIPGWEFRASFFDDKYTVGGTIQGAVALAAQGVRAVVGGTSSTLAIAAQNYLSAFNVSFISGTATSDLLSDKVTFPFFSRTIAPDRLQGRVVSDLAKRFNWRQVCTINYQGDYPTNLVNQFAAELIASASTAGEVSIVRATFTLSDTDVKGPIKVLADSKCRVIFGVLSASRLFKEIWVEAKAAGLLGPGIQWIVAESVGGEFSFQALRGEHDLNPDDLKGVMLVTPLAGKSDDSNFVKFRTDLAAWKGTATYELPDSYITYIYDSIWSLAYAARNIVQNPSLGSARLLDSTVFTPALREVRFNGVTGSVGFDRSGDRTNAVYGIFQWTSSQTSDPFPRVGLWEGNGVVIDTNKLVFADGSNNAPPDRLLIPETPILYSWGGIATITALAALTIVLIVLTFFLTVIYRKNSLIFKSSPFFLVVIQVGLVLLVASIFFWFGDTSPAKCHLRIWFGFVGFALAYGALLVKNARLWYLFTEPSLRIIAITNRQLVTYLLVLLGPQLVILVLWSSLSPFQVGSFLNSSGTTRYQLCRSENDHIFAPISFAYMGLLVVVGGVLSFKTRTLPDIFRESQYIALATYNYIFVATICIIIGYALTSEAVIGISVATVGIFFAALMQWGLLYVPKFYLIIFKPDVVAAMSNGTTTRGSKQQTTNTGSVSNSSKYDTTNSLP